MKQFNDKTDKSTVASINHNGEVEIDLPAPFSFSECLGFLSRSAQECLHNIKENVFLKLIEIDGKPVLLRAWVSGNKLRIAFPLNQLKESGKIKAAEYLRQLFDLNRDLGPFYRLAGLDPILAKLADQHYGLRIIGIPDLFEALSWAVIGQQINLTFAYTLKKRFVETFGESIIFEGDTYWLHPSFEKISGLDVADLTDLQFTTRKAEYVIGIATLMAKGELTKSDLLTSGLEEAKERLLKIRGVGAWTADYVMMKCLGDPSAFPIADIGLQNALKIQMGLDKKPSASDIRHLSKNWTGWEAYATFYLWRSLSHQSKR